MNLEADFEEYDGDLFDLQDQCFVVEPEWKIDTSTGSFVDRDILDSGTTHLISSCLDDFGTFFEAKTVKIKRAIAPKRMPHGFFAFRF